MKKIVLFLALCQISIFVFSQNFKIGAYFCPSNQVASYLKGSEFLKSDRKMFQSWEYGLFFDYKLNETYYLKASLGYSQNHLSLPNSLISSFQNNDIPLGIILKTNVLKIKNLSIYIENGLSIAFCNSYHYNGVIGASTSSLTGTISDYNFKNDWSFGFINGVEISYLVKSKFEINVIVNYYSGINKVWENNRISINEDGVMNNYTISSNGSSFNVGVGLGYCFY